MTLSPIPAPRLRRGAAALVMLAALAGCSPAVAPLRVVDAPGCPSAAEVDAMVQRYGSRQLLPNPPAGMSAEAAACGAARFVNALSRTLGPVVGYKAGLTNPVVQQRFGISTPLRGTLLGGMILADGVTVPAAFGARPFVEPDLVVEVGSAALHDARTPLEVLQHLRSVRPFIELPDTLVEDPARLTAPSLVLINVGARLGVLGAPVPVQATEAFADSLRSMSVVATNATGQELAKAPGAAILGHPLNAVIWLAADLRKAGITLKPGDLLSLGAFGNLPATAGQGIRVRYDGLPGNPSVAVSFR
jgi:2-keto-4-pentenoate hydratase